MYKVIIVDDEPIIVEGMTKALDWSKYNCRVVGCALSGKEGLELVEKEQPDILISDIHMPGMDGLTMIASVKSQYPQIQVMILTGYRDFDYCQRAISLGVSRFVLKPSKMEELEEGVQAMTEKLEPKSERNEDSVGNTADCDKKSPEQEEEVSIPGVEVCCNPASNFIVKQALAYIEEHYKERVKLSDVADHVYVSQWHLSKLLNRYTNQTFSDILNTIRIEKAKELLKDPALRIGDIAEEVGFLDMAHFSRVFKKLVGSSANEYRNQI